MSLHRALSNAILAKLRALDPVDGETNYRPDAVAEVTGPVVRYEDLTLDYEHLYFLRAEDEFPTEGTTGAVTRDAEWFIVGARQYREGTISVFQRTVTEAEIQDRIVADVERLFYRDPQFLVQAAQNVENARITDISRALRVDGWVIVELRVAVTYDTLRSE